MLSPNHVPKTTAPSIWSFDSGYASSILPEEERRLDLVEPEANSSTHLTLPPRLDENIGLGLVPLTLKTSFIGGRPQSGTDERTVEPLLTKYCYENDIQLPHIPADGEACLGCEIWRITNPGEYTRCEDCRALPQIIEPALLSTSNARQPLPSLIIPSSINMAATKTRCSACEMAAMMNPESPHLCPTCSPNPSLLSPSSPDPSDYRVRRSRAGRNSKLPPAALNTLQMWLDEHSDNPYPSSDEKRQLADECGITEKQVTTWFVNARARQLTPLDTHMASGSEYEDGDESDFDSAAQSGPYAGTGFTYMSEQSRSRRAGSVSAINTQAANKSQPSRRGKKKDYRKSRQPAIGEITTPDSAGSNLVSPMQSLSTSSLTSPNTSPEQETWQCTFCNRHLVPKSWRRHEETQHRPKANWTCMLYGPRISFPQRTTTANGTSFCAFCMTKDPSEDHFLHAHRITQCAKRPTGERTFLRPDHLRQHVKNFHGATLFDVVQARWKKAAEMGEGGEAWTCGFCAARLDTWDKRETHIANHFKQGMTMDQWVQWPEAESSKKGKGKAKQEKEKDIPPQPQPQSRLSFDRIRRSFASHSRRSQPEPQAQPQLLQQQQQSLNTTFSNSFEPLPASVTMSSAHMFTHMAPPTLPEINMDPLMMGGFADWQNVDFQFQDSSLYGNSAQPSDFDAALDNMLGGYGNSVDYQGPWTTQG